jgi:hypothetical protein
VCLFGFPRSGSVAPSFLWAALSAVVPSFLSAVLGAVLSASLSALFGVGMFASFVASVLVWSFGGPRAWSLLWDCVVARDWVAVPYYSDVVLLSGWPPAWVESSVAWLSRFFPVRASDDLLPF